MTAQHWIRSTDVYGMLGRIGGWHVGCANAREASEAIEYVIAKGWVTTRTHRAPAFPDGVPAYELTDAGLAHIREVRGERAFQSAGKMRKWYRDNAKKYLVPA